MRTSVACRRPGCAPRPRLGPAPAHAGSAWFGWASSGCATCSRGGGSGVASGSPPSPGRSRRPGSRSPSTARKHEPCRIPTLVRVNHPDAAGGDGMTQFGRALHELAIAIICANSPQAKGRVERAHKTLQDRLVKELRLAGIGTIEAANAFLPAFMADYNARFAKAPRLAEDLHRPLAPHDDLDGALTWREERTVTGSPTLHYDKVLFLLEPTDAARGLARKRVTVHEFPDGRLAIRHKGRDLPYRTFDKLRRVDRAAVVENERLGAVLAHIRDKQAETVRRRNSAAPSRSFQAGHMFPD